MYLPPKLDPLPARVLQLLLERSNIAGYDLQSMTGEKPADLIGALTRLRSNDLIQIVGSLASEREFMFARFAVLPTAKGIASTISRFSA